MRGEEEFAAEGGFGGAAIQAFFGGNASQVGGVVLLGQMGEDEKAGAAVENFGVGEEIADYRIGKMAGAAHDALLDIPRIRADFEHIEIVIGFEDEAIGFAQVMLDEFGEVAEIGDDSDLGAVGAEGVADGIGGIVGNGEGGNFDIADGEDVAGADVFDARKFFGGGLGENFFDFAMRRLGEIGRGAPFMADLRQAVGVIGVLVGDEDAVETAGLYAEGFEAAAEFFAIDAGVNEEAGALGLEQGAIARAAGRQNGDSKTDAQPREAAKGDKCGRRGCSQTLLAASIQFAGQRADPCECAVA